MLEIGPQLPIDGYVDAYDAESVNVLGIFADEVKQAKLITFPHGEAYEMWVKYCLP